MPFVTWSELAAKLRDDYASGNWRTKSYDFDGMKKEFFSPVDFLKVLKDVEARAVAESAEADLGAGFRTCARAGDR
jgi:hypothetical protein